MRRYLVHRLVRRLVGEAREPIKQALNYREPIVPTERELQFTDIALAFTAGACSMGIAAAVVVTYFMEGACN